MYLVRLYAARGLYFCLCAVAYSIPCGRIVMFRSVRERPGQSLIIIIYRAPNDREGLSNPQLDGRGPPPGGLVPRFSTLIRHDILLVLLQRVHLPISCYTPYPSPSHPQGGVAANVRITQWNLRKTHLELDDPRMRPQLGIGAYGHHNLHTQIARVFNHERELDALL